MPSATTLLSQYRSGSTSPVEVVDAALAAVERIRALDAFWAVDGDGARRAAQRAEAAHRSGRPTPPLLGVPVAVKDLFDTAELPTTYGAAMFRDHRPTADAAAVRALRRAGAIVIGKTATHEMAFGVTTVNPHFGPARNPHDPTRITGGSSGGSAAAVGAGVVPIALGSDTSCSIRLPAAFCGCVGFRPTHDTISTVGVMPLAPTFDTVGPLAACVADARLAAGVLWRSAAGWTRRCTTSPPPDRVRVGVIVDGWPVELTDDVQAAVTTAVAALEATGARVEPVVAAWFTDAHRHFGAAMTPEALHVHRTLGLWPRRAGEYGADVATRLRGAEAVTIEQHLDALARRHELRHAMADLFRRVDVIVSPAAATTAPLVAEADEPVHLGRRVPVRDLVLPFAVPHALAGSPAIVLPVGTDRDGLPTAVQLGAAVGADAMLLHVAARLEDALRP